MKYFVVTGASGSMGAEAVKRLASEGATVIMACRNMDKGIAVRNKIAAQFPNAQLVVKHVELGSQQSIRHFVSELQEYLHQEGVLLDGLFNNAGVINRNYEKNDDGLEKTVAVNYVAPVLLTRLLLPSIAPQGNIVNMVSLTCRFGKIDKHFFHKEAQAFGQLSTYANTKLALLLFSIGLARHSKALGCETLHINVADPGVVNSNMITMGRWFDPLADLLFRPFCSSPSKGVTPALRALSSSEQLSYFVGNKQHPIDKRYLDHPLIEWLWNETEILAGIQ